MTHDELVAWVRDSTARQGLPEHVADPSAIARIAELIAPTVAPRRRRAKKGAASAQLEAAPEEGRRASASASA